MDIHALAKGLLPESDSGEPFLAEAQSQSSRSLLWYLLPILYLASFAYSIGDGYFSDLIFQNDARQQITPYWWFHHGSGFESSLVYEYMLCYMTLGHRALYFLATYIFSPVIASQLIALLLTAGVLFYCYKLGSKSTHAAGAMLTVLVLRRHGWALCGGLPRSFGPLIALAFLYYFLSRNERGILAVLLAGALFYPSVFLICVGAYSLYVAVTIAIRLDRRSLDRAVRLACACGVCFLLLLPSAIKPAAIGKTVTLAQASEMPEWNDGGRFPELPLPRPWHEISKEPVHSLESFVRDPGPIHAPVGNRAKARVASLLLLVAICLLLVKRLAQRVLLPVLCFAAASGALYFLARHLAFRLFLPDRMLIYGIRFAIALTLCLGLAGIGQMSFRRWKIPAGSFALAVFMGAVLVLWHPGIPGRGGYADFGLVDKRRKSDFYGAISRLPSHSMIAGDPRELDNVLLTTGQNAYFTFETAHPLYDNYYREISRRIRAFHEAYFATTPDILLSFVKAERIDYLLINRAHFAANGVHNYSLFEPYDREVHEKYGSIDRTGFVLGRPNLSGVVCSRAEYFMVDTRRLAKALARK